MYGGLDLGMGYIQHSNTLYVQVNSIYPQTEELHIDQAVQVKLLGLSYGRPGSTGK